MRMIGFVPAGRFDDAVKGDEFSNDYFSHDFFVKVTDPFGFAAVEYDIPGGRSRQFERGDFAGFLEDFAGLTALLDIQPERPHR
jgi:hypothetical protein